MPSARAENAILVLLIAPPLICWGLERLVRSAHPRLRLAGTCSCVNDGRAFLTRNAADVVVLDLEEDAQTEESVGALLQVGSASKLLLLTDSKDETMLDRSVMAGLRGVVRKNEPPALLLRAVEKIHEDELWIDRAAASRMFMAMMRRKAAVPDDAEQGKIATLTLRERRTIAAVTSDAGLPGKVIADRLCISEHTLRNHLSSIYAKLGLANRLDLHAYALRHSLDEPR